jgi:hypothetical protein
MPETWSSAKRLRRLQAGRARCPVSFTITFTRQSKKASPGTGRGL